MQLRAERSSLLVVDLQERLLPAIHGALACVERCRALIRGARALQVPVLATEQYPKGLGHTVPAIAELLDAVPVLDKIHFSAADDPEIRARLASLDRDCVVVCGIEAHVCVLQSAMGLAEAGWNVFVAADATASRDPANRELALARMGRSDIEIVGVEMVLFEWLGRAGTPAFRELSALIKGL